MKVTVHGHFFSTRPEGPKERIAGRRKPPEELPQPSNKSPERAKEDNLKKL